MTINGKDFELSGEDLGKALRQTTMLAQLTTRKWSATKNDERAVSSLVRSAGAKGQVGKFHKNLLAGVDAPLKAINTLMQKTYNEHQRLTLPWVVEGQRLLASSKMASYLGTMGQYVAQLQPLVDSFCGQYDTLVQQAEQNLGSLFNQREYPPAGTIREMFKIDVSLQPVPSTVDWQQLTGASEGTLKALGVHTVRKIEAACAGARDELRGRARAWTERAIKSLSPNPEKPDKAAVEFHASLLTSLHQTVNDLTTMNVTNDPRCIEMAGILGELSSRLGDDIKALREQAELRAWVVQRATEAVHVLDEYALGDGGSP